MQILTIDAELVARGRAAFSAGTRQYLCGREVPGYAKSLRRGGGVAVVPGAIVAAIELGLCTSDEIVPTVARVSRCRKSTVSTILNELATDRVTDQLWAVKPDGTYRLVRTVDPKPFTLIAS